MIDYNPTILAISYILQFLGFLGIAYAWRCAFREWLTGRIVPKTRTIMLIITSVALVAYIFPAIASICFFIEGCFQPVYRDILRVTSGIILFLYGLFKFLLYYTKEEV